MNSNYILHILKILNTLHQEYSSKYDSNTSSGNMYM